MSGTNDPSQFAYQPPAPDPMSAPAGAAGSPVSAPAAAPSAAGAYAYKPPVRHEVTHKQTGVTRSYKTLKSALRAQDRADREYGGYITSRRAIYE